MRRSEVEMKIAVLRTISNKPRLSKTKLMYASNVNCSILGGFLEEFEKVGLIVKNPETARKTWKVTDKDREVLSSWHKVAAMLIGEQAWETLL